MLVFKGFTRTEFRLIILAHFKGAVKVCPITGKQMIVLEARLPLLGRFCLDFLSGDVAQKRRCVMLAL